MRLHDNEIMSLLADLCQQDYPSGITQEAAGALADCMRHLMDAVPEDERVGDVVLPLQRAQVPDIVATVRVSKAA